MEQIRTPRGKLFGTLDNESYELTIKDGTIVRIIQIPFEGIKLVYSSRDNYSEIVCIPPKTQKHK